MERTLSLVSVTTKVSVVFAGDFVLNIQKVIGFGFVGLVVGGHKRGFDDIYFIFCNGFEKIRDCTRLRLIIRCWDRALIRITVDLASLFLKFRLHLQLKL